MKKLCMGLGLAATLVAGVSANAYPGDVPTLARNVDFNARYLYDTAIRMGDYGYALSELGELSVRANRYANSLWAGDYENLKFAYYNSRRSWVALRVYSYERFRFEQLDRDMQDLISTVERPLPPPPPVPRVITVTGQGSGGTTHGDRAAACQKAEERALFDVAEGCSRQSGELLSSHISGACACHRKPGSRDDYTCRASAQGSCRIPF